MQPIEGKLLVGHHVRESRMLVECLHGDIVDMGTLKDTSTQLCGLTNRILADEERIHTTLTKGAPAIECWTGTRLVSPRCGPKKKNWKPRQLRSYIVIQLLIHLP